MLSRTWAHISRSWGGNSIYRCCFILSTPVILYIYIYLSLSLSTCHCNYKYIYIYIHTLSRYIFRRFSSHRITEMIQLLSCVCVWVGGGVCGCLCLSAHFTFLTCEMLHCKHKHGPSKPSEALNASKRTPGLWKCTRWSCIGRWRTCSQRPIHNTQRRTYSAACLCRTTMFSKQERR